MILNIFILGRWHYSKQALPAPTELTVQCFSAIIGPQGAVTCLCSDHFYGRELLLLCRMHHKTVPSYTGYRTINFLQNTHYIYSIVYLCKICGVSCEFNVWSISTVCIWYAVYNILLTLYLSPLKSRVFFVASMPCWFSQMETFSMLLALCEGNPPVTSGFPSQRPVTLSFDVFFDLHHNKQLSK